MDGKLEHLALKLQACRRRGNKLSLDTIIESAHILQEAKKLARRTFGRWLRQQAHMDPATARRHMRVADFAEANRALMPEIEKIGVSKVYMLTTLDFELARRYFTGQLKLSKPLEEMNDVQFRREFRDRYPVVTRRRTRQHVFQEVFSAIVRLRKALYRGRRFIDKLTPLQRRRIGYGLKDLAEAGAAWSIVG